MHGGPLQSSFHVLVQLSFLFCWVLLVVHIGISLKFPRVKETFVAWEPRKHWPLKPLENQELWALAVAPGNPADMSSWSQLPIQFFWWSVSLISHENLYLCPGFCSSISPGSLRMPVGTSFFVQFLLHHFPGSGSWDCWVSRSFLV